ncbi:hypothetical protein AMTRI_Chr12g270380 [Amborella trichopoda]
MPREALGAAWKAACGWKGPSRLVIPEGTFLVGPVLFKGSCLSAYHMIVQVKGKVKASTDMNKYPFDNWIVFQYVDGLVGASAWSLNQCPKKVHCKLLPTSLKFNFITNEAIRGIHYVGSLGKFPKEEDVQGLHVENCTISDNTNDLKIKTWAGSASSSASKFTYEDIVMNNVANPIIIDQQYCPYTSCSQKGPSRVKIIDISFKDIRGTSTSKIAVNLLCSIKLEYNGQGEASTASCTNVKGISAGVQIPRTCI